MQEGVKQNHRKAQESYYPIVNKKEFLNPPLMDNEMFRSLENVLATPHIGYVTEETYRVFYGDTVKAIADWLG